MTGNSDALKRINRIRVLNDFFRSTFMGGEIVITAAVEDLPLHVKSRLFLAVQMFPAFTPDDDPFAEHDFGSFELNGEKFFWKIDYYDQDGINGSEDPADPNKTKRVLTIMFADEY